MKLFPHADTRIGSANFDCRQLAASLPSTYTSSHSQRETLSYSSLLHHFAIMTITDLVRNPEGPSPRLRPNPLRLPRLNSFTFPSRPTVKRQRSKLSSGSNGSNIRQKLQRGVSNIRTFFRSRNQDSDHYDTEHGVAQALLISQDGGHSGFTHRTTSANPLRLHLTTVSTREIEDSILTEADTHESAPCNKPVSYRSVTPLRRRISSKLLASITSSPTVIIKPELRSRPSVQTICYDRDSTNSTSASTQHTSSTTKKESSTPPTSEGTMPGSPGSVCRQDLDLAATNDQLLVLLDHRNVPRKLSTIQEIDGQQIATIRTIEATASAK